MLDKVGLGGSGVGGVAIAGKLEKDGSASESDESGEGRPSREG
jgi:hypothetical protein